MKRGSPVILDKKIKILQGLASEIYSKEAKTTTEFLKRRD